MPSSFVDSVPPIMKAIIDFNPHSIVDVGPGWGKYGLMCREYLPLLGQLHAVEVPEGRLATQDVIYDSIAVGDVRSKYLRSNTFSNEIDLVLMIDVIEHMTKEEGQEVMKEIVNGGSALLISTPKVFEEQHNEHNPHEEHICVWDWEDFWTPGMTPCRKEDHSTIDSIIMLLIPEDTFL